AVAIAPATHARDAARYADRRPDPGSRSLTKRPARATANAGRGAASDRHDESLVNSASRSLQNNIRPARCQLRQGMANGHVRGAQGEPGKKKTPPRFRSGVLQIKPLAVTYSCIA